MAAVQYHLPQGEVTAEDIDRAREALPSLWVEKHKILNESGQPIEFDDHFFMRDLYDDMSNLQVWLKPPQIGATVAQIIKTMYCAKKLLWDIIYTLPTQSDVYDMAGGKINRLVAQNPILLGWVRDHDTVEQKSIGSAIIHYRGTFTAKAAMMVSSHLNVHDEVDASDAEVINQYETRLMAKPIEEQRRWYFSHPSLAGMGVDVYWQQSDKKEWFIKCGHCNLEQQLSWPNNVDLVTRQYVCQGCRSKLSKDSIRYGCWKPTSSGPFSGYHISQLMCVWITAEKVIGDYETKDSQYFWNYVLGYPFIGSENKIEPSVVLKNVTNEVENLQHPRVVIGVDTGNKDIHYVCMNRQGVFYYDVTKPVHVQADGTVYDPYSRLEWLLNHFERSIVVADQGGDLIGIRRLRAKYPGRVFLCYYRKDRKTEKLIQWGDGDAYGTVLVDRNRMMSLIVEQLREPGLINLDGVPAEWETFASHFGNIYREKVVVKESIGKDVHTLYGNEYVWKRNGPDHFVHALLYALTGMDRYGEDLATIIKGRDPFMANVAVAGTANGAVPAQRIVRKQGITQHKVDF